MAVADCRGSGAAALWRASRLVDRPGFGEELHMREVAFVAAETAPAILRGQTKAKLFTKWVQMGPLLFYLKEEVVELTEAWFQAVIDREVEGVELVVLEDVGSKRQKIIRLYIDHPDGVTHELCARVSACGGTGARRDWRIEGSIHARGEFAGHREALRKRSHFEAQLGKKVYVKARVPMEGSKVWQGILLEVGAEEIVVTGSGARSDGSRWAR